MSALIPFMCVEEDCDQVLSLVSGQLRRAGFHVVPTFDLQVARLAHPDRPQRGTEDCSCQMVVLLVYGKRSTPETLVIHGHAGRTWLSLANPTGGRADPQLEAAIRRALTPGLIDIGSSREVIHEGRPQP